MMQCRNNLQPNRRPRRIRRNKPGSVIVMLLVVGLAGCAADSGHRTSAGASGKYQANPSAITDSCDARLQDLAGALLAYYLDHNELPPNLKVLKLPSGDSASALTCPVSHQPYIYDPQGLPAPDGKSRLVIYDAVPAHGSFRWAVAIAERQGGQPLVANVIAVPEAVFSLSGKR